MKTVFSRKKIISFGILLVGLFFVMALPTFAIQLCPTNGVKAPGCGGEFNLTTTLSSVINLLLLAAFIIALIFLIIGGIKWILSGGDKEGANKARDTVTSALIGLAVVLASFVLINLVLTVITGQNLGDVDVSNIQIDTGSGTTPPPPGL